jgi:hypothetical protein
MTTITSAILPQILRFIPLQQLIQCRSVCKGWKSAADRELTENEILLIRIRGKADQCQNHDLENEKYEDSTIWIGRGCRDRTIRSLMHRSLIRMASLKIFIFANGGPAFTDMIDHIVYKNCNSLKVIRTEKQSFPHVYGIRYPVLQTISCSRIHAMHKDVCPLLKEITIVNDTSFTGHAWKEGDMDEFVQSLTILPDLRKVVIITGREGGRNFVTSDHVSSLLNGGSQTNITELHIDHGFDTIETGIIEAELNMVNMKTGSNLLIVNNQTTSFTIKHVPQQQVIRNK